MSARERTVLHVLPHPGGGGETYVDALSRMDGYRFDRAYLAASPDPAGARGAILRRAVEIQRAAFAVDLVHVIGEVASTLMLPALGLRPSAVSPQGLSLMRRASGLSRRAARGNLRLIVRAATRTICCSDTEYADVLGAVGASAAARARVIRNGVTLADRVSPQQQAAFREELGLPATAAVGVWIGTLDGNKDPLCAIQAAITARDRGAPTTLLVAGDGPLRAEVEAAARESEAVQFLGFRLDVGRLLGASDFFVLSSRREGLSYALLEAMSLGLVPVVSDAPGNQEAVGEAGIVVPFGDREAFAAAFARMAYDEAARSALGDRARDRVSAEFRLDEMIRRTRALYDEIGRLR